MDFVCDTMLGSLSKWLRLLGIKTIYNPQSNSKENFLTARRENSIFLTKNTHYMNYDRTLFLFSDSIVDQIKEINDCYENFSKHIKTFSLCSDCGSCLSDISKENIKEKIPVYVYYKFDNYKICSKCNKIYWKGSHYKKILHLLRNILYYDKS